MTKLLKLKGKVVENDLSPAEIAKALNVTDTTYYRIIAGKRQINVREAEVFYRILHLTKEEFLDIFFSELSLT